jgi:hypothetical protein
MDMQGLLDHPVKPGEDKKAAKLYIDFRNNNLFDKSVSTKLGIRVSTYFAAALSWSAVNMKFAPSAFL